MLPRQVAKLDIAAAKGKISFGEKYVFGVVPEGFLSFPTVASESLHPPPFMNMWNQTRQRSSSKGSMSTIVDYWWHKEPRQAGRVKKKRMTDRVDQVRIVC